MKQKLLLSLMLVALPASAAAADAPLRTTTKGAEPFAQCFAAAQDHASRPWSFVPKASGGGTFSNLGARGVRQPYFLDVAHRGGRLEIRLAPGGDAAVLRAVDTCL